MRLLLRFILVITIPAISFCTAAQNSNAVSRTEMRGVWIATVANIDWPSQTGLSSKQQKAEFDSLLNVLQSMNMNAVFVQVRPAGDALYKSKLVPMSAFLTGKQGKQPDDPSYDPLAYMIAAAHRRGMEFHAWMNPYRATWDADTTALDKKHPMKSLPSYKKKAWFFKYGKKWYFNPANQEVRDYLTSVVKEVVTGYDVDGIHFDDYYYPYKEQGLDLDAALNDSRDFSAGSRGFTNIHDWRRDNVSKLIKSVSEAINSARPDVQFGISPFGVWRNKDKDPDGSDTRAGITCYDDSYADVLL
ncbi:MAG: glycoside hydrolase family 10 protein, partial [Bacteroidota bacterium]